MMPENFEHLPRAPYCGGHRVGGLPPPRERREAGPTPTRAIGEVAIGDGQDLAERGTDRPRAGDGVGLRPRHARRGRDLRDGEGDERGAVRADPPSARLARSAAGLGLPEPDHDVLAQGALEVLAAAPKWPLARIRITYTSGPGPLGSARGDAGPTVSIIVGPQDPFPATADVTVVPWPRNERGALSGLKTTSYAENALALAYARSAAAARRSSATPPGTCARGRAATSSSCSADVSSRRRCRRAAWPG